MAMDFLKRRRIRRKKMIALYFAQKVQAARSYQIIGRIGNIKRHRKHVLDKIQMLSADVFKQHYRLSQEDFYPLLDSISNQIGISISRESEENIQPIIKLCTALRFVAGGSFLDIAFGYEVALNHVHTYIGAASNIGRQSITSMNCSSIKFSGNVIPHSSS